MYIIRGKEIVTKWKGEEINEIEDVKCRENKPVTEAIEDNNGTRILPVAEHHLIMNTTI